MLGLTSKTQANTVFYIVAGERIVRLQNGKCFWESKEGLIHSLSFHLKRQTIKMLNYTEDKFNHFLDLGYIVLYNKQYTYNFEGAYFKLNSIKEIIQWLLANKIIYIESKVL